MRLTALLLPEPQGPFRATTVPSGALILRILAARVFANGSIPNRSSDGSLIGLSLCGRLVSIMAITDPAGH